MTKHRRKDNTKEALGRKISAGRRKAINREQMFEIERLQKQGLSVLEICQVTGLGEGTVIKILRAIRRVADSAANLGAGRVSSIGAVVSLASSVIERQLEGKQLLTEENKRDFASTVLKILRAELGQQFAPGVTRL
jgi:transposase